MRRPVPALAGALLFLALLSACTTATPRAEPTVVYLVRHAERAEDGTANPPISEEGRERARLLSHLLRDAGVTEIHTTDLRRTRQTGQPLAESTGLAMSVYDPNDLEGFAARLRATPGRHLVLGHSNTTPAVVEALGGEPGPPIDEPAEYDRLYVVTLTDGGTSTVLLRFGAPFEG